MESRREQQPLFKPRLAVTSAVEGEAWWVIRIEDNGPGVPAEVLSQVFEPFFTTKARGTGLGLAMARRLVEAHGGSIELHSGSVFRIQL